MTTACSNQLELIVTNQGGIELAAERKGTSVVEFVFGPHRGLNMGLVLETDLGVGLGKWVLFSPSCSDFQSVSRFGKEISTKALFRCQNRV